MSRRLNIYIHRPVSNARASHRVVKDVMGNARTFELTFLTSAGQEIKKRVRADTKERAEEIGRSFETKSQSLAKVAFISDKSFADSIRDALGGTKDAEKWKAHNVKGGWLVDVPNGGQITIRDDNLTEQEAIVEAKKRSGSKDTKSFADTIRDTLGGTRDAKGYGVEEYSGSEGGYKGFGPDGPVGPMRKTRAEAEADIQKAISSNNRGAFGKDKSFADSIGAMLIGGNEKPEDKGAKRTPLVADGKGWEVEFDKKPGRHSIPSEADQHVEAVAKRLGLWKGGNDEFPGFTIYRDGEEMGGG